MATVSKKTKRRFWRHQANATSRDPDAEQLHRTRLTALVALIIMVLIVAGIVALAAFSGAPTGGDVIEPWIMM